MSDDKEMNPNSVSLEEFKEMDQGEARTWLYVKLNDLSEQVDRIDKRLWGVLTGVIIVILLILVRAFLGA